MNSIEAFFIVLENILHEKIHHHWPRRGGTARQYTFDGNRTVVSPLSEIYR